MAVRPVEEQDCEEEAMEAECEFGARKAEMMRSPSLQAVPKWKSMKRLICRSGVGAVTASEGKESKPSTDD